LTKKKPSLDSDLKDQLISMISLLLADRSNLVLGSALTAFNEICPDRFDLLHPHYRKFCNYLADIDEWGQAVVISVLTRYARTQFKDPNKVSKREKKIQLA